jgi:hypothetical protein
MSPGNVRVIAAVVLVVVSCAVTPVAAQAPAERPPVFEPPRLPDGHPDLQGLWVKKDSSGFDPLRVGTLDGGAVGRGGGGRGRAGGPPGGNGNPEFLRPGVPILPYTNAAAAEKKNRFENHLYDDPEAHCHVPGIPRGTEQPPYPFMIIQDEKYVTILYEYVHDVRIIPTDGSAHPKNYKAWDGDSRGHWEGDTFVVDVSNFNGKTWLDMEGNFVDENEHVVERYTLVDRDTIAYEATVTDPTVFTKPWTMKLTLKRLPETEQLLEYGCIEGERDLQHYTTQVGGKAK